MEQPSDTTTLIDLMEGAVKRAVVIRGGKRKVLMKCKPGEKKVGRQCRRRSTSDLNKLKRRAKRAARKARTKRMRALRKRKLSLKRRKTIPQKKHSHTHTK